MAARSHDRDHTPRLVLVSFVGSSDPVARGSPGPVMSILKHLHTSRRVDSLILLTTASHRHTYRLPDGQTLSREQPGLEQNLDATVQAVKSQFPGIHIDQHLLEVNPANVDEVLSRTVEVLSATNLVNAEVHYNISSGTQAMSAVVTFLSDSPLVPRHTVWQVLDPTKIPEAFPRVKEVNFGFLSERDRLERACRSLELGAFLDSRKAFQELAFQSYIPGRRDRARALSTLMEAYEMWDAGDFAPAYEKLRAARNELKNAGLGILTDLVDPQEAALRSLQVNPGKTTAFLQFIHARALRRNELGHYSAVATMARRMYEGVLDHFGHIWSVPLRSGFGSSSLTLAAKYQAIDDLLKKGKRRAEIGRLRSVGVIYLREIEKARNYCLEEHGTAPVNKDQAAKLLKAMMGLWNLAMKGTTMGGTTYMSPADLRDMSSAVRQYL